MLLTAGRRLRFEFDFLGRGRAVIAWLKEVHHAVEGRRAIARMDARMLSDIGLSHGEARHEISRLPWDIEKRK
jgi:uncharacterized protein YjiS (DUF1127 family)